jgi:hypothetical protein
MIIYSIYIRRLICKTTFTKQKQKRPLKFVEKQVLFFQRRVTSLRNSTAYACFDFYSQFKTALGSRAGNFTLNWAGQVMTSRDQVDAFEERRTELEKQAGEAFESKECWFFCDKEQMDSIVKNGYVYFLCEFPFLFSSFLDFFVVFFLSFVLCSFILQRFPATLKSDSATFAVNPAVAISQAKHSGDVAQNKDDVNRVLLCRVSIGKEGMHHRTVGHDDQLRYVISDVRG